jgi:hypothetical protein
MESFEYYRDASGFWRVKNIKGAAAPRFSTLLRAVDIRSRVYLYYISVREYVADPDTFSIIACALSPDPCIFELVKEDTMYLTA